MTDVPWFEDDTELARELLLTRAADDRPPVVPGHEQLRLLARGGQGVVYTALQRATRRVVAIKVLRESPVERDRRRFEREIDLASTLKHANVVSIYDAGTTGDGRPFLVMELVDGPAVDCAACVIELRQAPPTRVQIDRVVELMARVGDGVAYAHRRGVVHRDLKPSNIRLDAEGTPKVLDFGLAKDLTGIGDDLTFASGSSGARFLGSLPWASPEQAQGAVESVDVRSDVYALGLILYRMLTGRFPYDVDSDLRSTLHAIVERTPLPPRRLLPAMPSDLETVLLRCLQKDPDRRYQSAGELVDDLRRYLSGAPIAARRDSTWYLLHKTARKHRIVVALATLVVLSLAVGLSVAVTLWRRAEAGRRIAVDNARRADAAMNYFSDTLMAVDPDRDGPDAKVVDLLHRAAADLEHHFPDDPDSKYFFLVKLADLYKNLSALPQAEPQAALAIRVATAAWGDGDTRTLFAHALHGGLLHQMGRDDEALPELLAAAATVRKTGLLDSTASAHVHGNLGLCLLASNRADEAEQAFRTAAAVTPTDDRTSQLHNAANENLATIADWRGDTATAIGLMRGVLTARERDLGPEHSATLRSASNLAFYLSRAGQPEAAEPIMARNLEICRRRFGPRGIETLSALNNHAHYLQVLGQAERAEQETRECLEGRIAVLGEEHPHTLVTLNNLATLELDRGDVAAAERDSRRLLQIRTRKLGARHADTLIAGNNLAHLLERKGDHDGAIAQLRQVVADATAGLGAAHWMTALFASNLGADLLAQHDFAGAEPLLRDAVRVLEQQRGHDHPDTRGARQRLCELLRATDRSAEAEALQHPR